ncbi:IMP dehydrogenase [bacterium]|jgi:GMP reductase|nr:IMP dehydrogenase [bacterium]|tara:strand:+ start:1274 stop:2302 length:1029 start_codon:yes stop_codon:yes gene_type:complete
MKVKDLKLDFSDVLIEPCESEITLTRKSVDIEIEWLDTTATPVIVSNMLSTGTYKIANILTPERIFTFIHKEYTVEQHINELEKMKDRRFIAITSGVRLQDREKTIEVISKFPDIGIINVDIANVYANIQGMIDTIKIYREKFPNIQICAGNVATASPIQKFVKAGATLIKVGVGSGAACRTRSEVGTGVPQLSAIMDCYTEAQKYGAGIISDGGCVTAGDVCKAIGAGAKMVMVAGMVSKSEECDNIVEIDGKKYVNFYGLGSTTMYNRTNPTEQEYRPNEGRDLLIPCKGSIKSILKQIQGGLRSVCTYVGAENITQLYKRTTFVRVNNQINNSLAKYEQ